MPASNTGDDGMRGGHIAIGRRALLHGALALAALRAAGAAPADAAAADQAGQAPPDQRLTDLARLLAGVDPLASTGANPFIALMQTEAWRQHRRASQAGWSSVRKRIERIDAWQRRNLPRAAPGSTLVYPFSGPDFINAYALFPDQDSYVFFSLEPPGSVPALEAIDERDFGHLLSDLRYALNDVVQLNFFITPNMKTRLQTDSLSGIAPVLLSMMGLMDLRIGSVAAFDPWPERSALLRQPGARQPPQPLQALRIGFDNPRTGRAQELRYYSLDVSDPAIGFYPEFIPQLRELAAPSVLLKSASYLLHGDGFHQVRDFIRDRAALLVQDDTGMPYRLLRQAGFVVTLHGQYEHPVKLFENRYQKDLDDAFAARGDQASLPFPFGYNWRKDGRSGLMVATRVQRTS
jgi:hypothetical protein